jgi:hypothetical protein
MVKVQFSARVADQATEEEFTGWWNPAQQWTLFTEDTDVPTFEFPNLTEAEEFIEKTLGDVSMEIRGTRYAIEVETNVETGETWSRAAHLEVE